MDPYSNCKIEWILFYFILFCFVLFCFVLFCFVLSVLHSLWDPSSPFQGSHLGAALKVQNPNRWTTREFPEWVLFYFLKNIFSETSLVVQWLSLCTSRAWGTCLIPGRRTKILHAMSHSQKKILPPFCSCSRLLGEKSHVISIFININTA